MVTNHWLVINLNLYLYTLDSKALELVTYYYGLKF